MSDQINRIRVICSGSRASRHVVRELVVLHRRTGRPDRALAAYMEGDYEAVARYERFIPGWDAAGSYTSFEPGRGRRSHRKTEALVVPARNGGQVVHIPSCPECDQGRGLRLSVSKLEDLTATQPGGIDISAFYA